MPKVSKKKTYSLNRSTPYEVKRIPYTYIRSETNLFGDPVYDVTVSGTYPSEYHPVTSLDDKQAPIEFFLKGNDLQYIDLKETKLYIRCKLKNTSGEDIKDYYVNTGQNDADGKALTRLVTPRIVPVNNFLHSLFQRVSVSLNETLVTPSNNNYAFRSYIETLLGFSKEYKKSQATCAMYFKDKPVEYVSDTEDGRSKRHAIAGSSAEFELIGRPFVDLFFQERWLIPGVDMRVSFTRSSDEFNLINNNAHYSYTAEIKEAKLLVKKRTVLPSVLMNHFTQWNKRPIVYPLRQVDVKSFTVAPSTMQVVNENLIHGLLPYRIILALLPSQTYIGSWTTNPFTFSHQNVSYVNVQLNGEHTTNTPLQLNYEKERYLEAYNALFEGLGLNNEDCGLDISKEDFKNTSCLYVYNFSQAKDSITPPAFGTGKIELKFAKPPSVALTCLVYCEYPASLLIDSQKNIFYKDFSQAE